MSKFIAHAKSMLVP